MCEFVENKSICSRCGGRCCKNNPGVYKGGEVLDFEDNIGVKYGIVVDLIMNPYIAEQLIPNFADMPDDLKIIAYDNWNMIIDAGLATEEFFVTFLLALRPLGMRDYCAIVGTKFMRIGNTKGNACTFLGSDGCRLELKDRPYECKILKPQSNFICGHEKRYGYLGVDIASSWIPYQDTLRECFIEYCESLDAKTIEKVRNQGDDLMNSIIDEGFLGIYVTNNGQLRFIR